MIVEAKLEVTDPIDHTRAAKYKLTVGGSVVFDNWEHHLTSEQKAAVKAILAGAASHFSKVSGAIRYQ